MSNLGGKLPRENCGGGALKPGIGGGPPKRLPEG